MTKLSPLLVGTIAQAETIKMSTQAYASIVDTDKQQAKNKLALVIAYNNYAAQFNSKKLIKTDTSEFKRRFPLNDSEIEEARLASVDLINALKNAQETANQESDCEVPEMHSSSDIVNSAHHQDCIDISGKKPMDAILDAYHTIHEGDNDVCKAVTYSFCSTRELTNTGLPLKASGVSGTGKSHSLKAGVTLLPQRIVVDSSFSDKALLYRKGHAGEIIYVDESQQISPDMCGLLKSSISNFQNRTKYTTLDAERESFEVFIEPRTIYMLSAVDSIGDEQLISRMFPISISRENSENIKRINEFRAKCYIDGLPPLHITPSVTAVREMLAEYLDKLFIVKIPYANNIVWANPDDFRLNEFVITIIKANCVLNYKNRECESTSEIEVNGETFELKCIKANKEDFDTTMEMTIFQRSVSAKHRFTPSEEKLIKFLEGFKGQTIKRSEIIEKAKINDQNLTNLIRGRDGKSGLMFKIHAISEVSQNDTASSGLSYSSDSSRMSKSEKAYKIGFDLPHLSETLDNVNNIAYVNSYDCV